MVYRAALVRHSWRDTTSKGGARLLLRHSSTNQSLIHYRLCVNSPSRLFSTSPQDPLSTAVDKDPLVHVQSQVRKSKLELHPAPKKPSASSEVRKPPTLPNSSTTLSSSKAPSSTPTPNPLSTSDVAEVIPSTALPSEKASTSSAIQTAIEDMRLAAQHGIFSPPPEGAGKIGKGWHQVKQLFKFYVKGLKMLWVHRKTVKEIQQRLREEAVDGKPARMTRWEYQFIRTYQQDQIKLIPFLIILIVLEEALPLVALYMPSLLPSTCVLPSQQERIEEKAEKEKASAIVDVQAWLKQNSLSAQTPQTLDSALARNVCKIFTLSARGPGFLRQRRLEKYLSYLEEDDMLLSNEGSGSRLTEIELKGALRDRGFVTSKLQDTELRPLLSNWLTSVGERSRLITALEFARIARVDGAQ